MPACLLALCVTDDRRPSKTFEMPWRNNVENDAQLPILRPQTAAAAAAVSITLLYEFDEFVTTHDVWRNFRVFPDYMALLLRRQKVVVASSRCQRNCSSWTTWLFLLSQSLAHAQKLLCCCALAFYSIMGAWNFKSPLRYLWVCLLRRKRPVVDNLLNVYWDWGGGGGGGQDADTTNTQYAKDRAR